jgi:hypothetical protein
MRYCNSLSSTLTWSVATVGATLVASASLAQDECSSAVTVTAGVPAAFDTTAATPSANPPTDTQCAGTFLNWGESPDVWFRFVAPQGGIADFSTCLAGSYDTSIAIYRGTSCNDITQIACNGDGTGLSGCQQYYSYVSGVSAQAGDIFYIRIGGYEAETGAGQLTVTFNAVTGACATATGECGEPHGGLGCNDPVCCAAVCDFNPLCCEFAWDESCVQGAVDACGLFFYQCVAGGPVNNCATNATLVTASGSRAFSSIGATTDGPIHTGATCNSGSDFFYNDIWWRVPVAANGTLTISTCGTTPYDNKLAVYDMGTDPASYDFNTLPDTLVACNDDGASGECFLTDGVTNYASEMSVTVQSGRTYLVRMGSYIEDDTGSGSINFTVPVPCQLDNATQAEAEACGGATNNGCNAGGEAENVLLGAIVSGTFWSDAGTRDTDFYRLSIASDTQVSVSVKSASFAGILILGGDLSVPDCDGITVLATGSGACPATVSSCLPAGEYFIFVGPANADGSASFEGNPCGNGVLNSYTMQVTGEAATCPVFLETSCAAPGPNTSSLNADPNTVANGLVACAVGGAAGGTTQNSFARVFQAGAIGGEISCLNFGVFCAQATAAGTFVSDLPLPGVIGIYRDINGGAPTRVQLEDGDGGDLVEIFSTEFFAPGGVYKATLPFEEPLCIEDFEGSNIVVVLDLPSLLVGNGNIPANSGYQFRAGGNTAGPEQNTYCRLSCADGAGQFVLTESLGATFTAQWVVEINGDFAQCNGGGNDCPADLDGNGVINGFDLSAVLAGWGTASGDTNGDGTTNGIDITTILSAWNTNCP